jgi:GH43 family beta-xylosidase
MERNRRKKWVLAMLAAAALVFMGVWMLEKKETVTGEVLPYYGHGGTFKNTLSEMDTPDPSLAYHDGWYYMTFTHNGTDIMVMKSPTLDFRHAEKKVVWYPPVDTMYSANLWAPEIQYIRGKWYIYFAADNGTNQNHRMYALEADSDDPMGSYTFRGKITDETDKWAIDGLVMEHEDALYFIWSGWEGDVNIRQNTYIAPMSDPLTISGPRVLLSQPDLLWEQLGGPPYINEGQAILKKDGRVFLVYSGAGSWTPFYALGMLALTPGADPLDPSGWTKSQEPLLAMNEDAGVYGPGHNTFAVSPDGTEHWIVYHATSGISDGWSNRKARAQQVEWNEDGLPSFGQALSLDTAIPVPSGSGVFRAEYAQQADGTLSFDRIYTNVATEAPLLVHYRNEMGATTEAAVSVNGTSAIQVKLPKTSAGEIGYAYTAYIPLQPGRNTVEFAAAGDGWSVEAIEVPRFEAENAQAGPNGTIEENPFASGWGVAETVAGEGVGLRFDNVHVPRHGTYGFRFAVANATGVEQRVKIRANGGKAVTLTVAPGERNRFDRVEVSVGLRSGTNEITLEDATGALSFDYVDIGR